MQNDFFKNNNYNNYAVNKSSIEEKPKYNNEEVFNKLHGNDKLNYIDNNNIYNSVVYDDGNDLFNVEFNDSYNKKLMAQKNKVSANTKNNLNKNMTTSKLTNNGNATTKITIKDTTNNKNHAKNFDQEKIKWSELNQEWDVPNNNQKVSSISPVSSVNQLLPDNKQRIKLVKPQEKMFDDQNLHIKKKANNIVLKIETLVQAPKDENENDSEEENRKKRNEKFDRRKQKLEEEKQKLRKDHTDKVQPKKKQKDVKIEEKNKIYETKQNISKNGENFNVEKKIFRGDTNFVFTLTMPDKLTKKEENNNVNDNDSRAVLVKNYLEKSENEKSIYLGQEHDQSHHHELKLPSNNTNNQTYEVDNRKKSIIDKQHMHVFKSFKVDQITVISNEYHQPIEKSFDLRHMMEANTLQKEVPKQDNKFVEIKKKDIINENIKYIENNQASSVKEIIPTEKENNKSQSNPIPSQNEANVRNLKENLLNNGLNQGENIIPPKINETSQNKPESKMSVFSNIGGDDINNYHSKESDRDKNLNISRISKRLSNLDIDEVWDNSVIEEDNRNLFDNSVDSSKKN